LQCSLQIEEEEYTTRVIHYFSSGLITLPEGKTLRSYLADKLQCDPMRITKKYAGAACLGKRIHILCESPKFTPHEIEMAKDEIERLEERFRMRLALGAGATLPPLQPAPVIHGSGLSIGAPREGLDRQGFPAATFPNNFGNHQYQTQPPILNKSGFSTDPSKPQSVQSGTNPLAALLQSLMSDPQMAATLVNNPNLASLLSTQTVSAPSQPQPQAVPAPQAPHLSPFNASLQQILQQANISMPPPASLEQKVQPMIQPLPNILSSAQLLFPSNQNMTGSSAPQPPASQGNIK
jgi:hypothetical protein